ncbi:MAG: CAP domain-containing protein [Acidimicrobiales bacterium]
MPSSVVCRTAARPFPSTIAAPIHTAPINTACTDTAPTPTEPACPPQRRRPRCRSTGFAFALVGVLGLLLTGCLSPEETDLLGRVNQARAAEGLPALNTNEALTTKARNWAGYMASVGDISHSDLRDGAPAGWTMLGENVGVGTSIEQIHHALMNSPGHRANIMSGQFNQVGIGVVHGGDGRLYVTQVFMR